ncbi:MAG TPA: SRPBCC family protein [Acidimicrobiales bacterium]|nr:SRPBCC family protein [Acidimicrobiales bacterium]
MEITNEFEVAVPIEEAWVVLTDLERLAPCLPGAQLREVEGDEYRGAVKIKVGPITTSYDGAIRFLERDESTHRMVLKAEGRETRGQGNVAAVITATMSPSGGGTSVVVATDLTISGKVAQFGRGVLADVSAKLLDQFVVNLESTVLAKDDGNSREGVVRADFDEPGAPAPEHDVDGVSEGHDSVASPSAIRQIHSEPVEPVDLVEMAGGSVARRAMKPLLIAGVATAVALRFVRRRRK